MGSIGVRSRRQSVQVFVAHRLDGRRVEQELFLVADQFVELIIGSRCDSARRLRLFNVMTIGVQQFAVFHILYRSDFLDRLQFLARALSGIGSASKNRTVDGIVSFPAHPSCPACF